MRVHKEPDKAIRGYAKDINGLSGDKRQTLIRTLCKEDPWFLVRYVFDWWFADEHLHGQIIPQFYKDNEGKDTLLLLPRGHMKTLMSVVFIVQDILTDPNSSTLVVSSTEDLAKSICALVAQHLRYNPILVNNFPELPQENDKLDKWGVTGYTLPRRKPRIEPTLYIGSLKKGVTGTHPDKIRADDITGISNNDPNGYKAGIDFLTEAKNLLYSNGTINWNATHWNDSAPSRLAERGHIQGKQGPFQVLKMTCFKDGDREKAEPIYPEKRRWNSPSISGHNREGFLAKMNSKLASVRQDFNCQQMNDPAPLEESTLDLEAVNTFKALEDAPPICPPITFGIEAIGGGQVLFNGLDDLLVDQGLNIPIEEISYPSKRGIEKHDRIRIALEPIINDGRFHCIESQWPEHDADEGTLRYELSRLGAARNDDIGDAVHIVPEYLSKGLLPRKGEPAHVYLAADTAYGSNAASDYSVLVAVAVDQRAHYWLLDVERFQLKSPSAIHRRIIDFYYKWLGKAQSHNFNRTRSKSKSLALKYK